MIRLGIIFAACLVLTGCISSPSVEEKIADRLYPEPIFAVGDAFVFDNPYVRWQVIAIRDGKVHWNSDGGDLQITDVNPLMPVLAWESPVHGKGRRLISGKKGSLFPIQTGKKSSFRATVSMDKPPYGWEFDWDCEVVGRVAVRGPANREYDTYKVKCGRRLGDELTFFTRHRSGIIL